MARPSPRPRVGTPIAPGCNRLLPVVVPTRVHFDGDNAALLHLADPLATIQPMNHPAIRAGRRLPNGTRTRMHRISVGRAHAGTPVIPLIADLDLRVVATATGELLRHLPSIPTSATSPAKNDEGPYPMQVRSLPMSRDITLCARRDLNPQPPDP